VPTSTTSELSGLTGNRLVELIVLNIGLQAGILNPRAFSMFVVHAVVLTVMTTPLVLFFYPPKVRRHSRFDPMPTEKDTPALPSSSDDEAKTRFAVVLDRIEAVPPAMTLTQLLHSSSSSSSSIVGSEKAPATPPVTIEALRLMEVTSRTSAVLKSQEVDTLIYNDPVITVFRTFGQLNRFNVSSNLSVVDHDEFPDAIASHAREANSQMIIVPWPRGATSHLEEQDGGKRAGTRNPFDGIFHKTTTEDQTSSVIYSEYIRNVFQKAPTDVALFVDRGLSTSGASDAKQHLFLPFFGGPDDRLALNFLIQICQTKDITATVVKLSKSDGGKEEAAAAVHPAYHNVRFLALNSNVRLMYDLYRPSLRLILSTATLTRKRD
jgi:hypothetical protein